MEKNVVKWLLEDRNPEVKLRVQKELLNADIDEINATKTLLKSSKIYQRNMELIAENKPWSVCYALTAFAEWGLTREDVNINQRVDWVIEKTNFNLHCGKGMLLRSLVKLGFTHDKRVWDEINSIFKLNKDGGFQCISKNKKMNDPTKPHKSCYRLTFTFLTLLAELKLQNISLDIESQLIHYFLNRDVLFRNDNGKFIIDEYCVMRFPTDCICHGIQEIIYCVCAMGYGSSEQCNKIWGIVKSLVNENGRYILNSRPSKPYFNVGVINKENKWVTLYMLLAQKYRNQQ